MDFYEQIESKEIPQKTKLKLTFLNLQQRIQFTEHLYHQTNTLVCNSIANK